jgi:ABC-type iron transport system FetAB permease component
MLLVENARSVRGAQAAVESMRNEVVQRQDQLNNAVALGQRQAAKQIGEDEWNKERLLKAT